MIVIGDFNAEVNDRDYPQSKRADQYSSQSQWLIIATSP